jgi:hypothetical protein
MPTRDAPASGKIWSWPARAVRCAHCVLLLWGAVHCTAAIEGDAEPGSPSGGGSAQSSAGSGSSDHAAAGGGSVAAAGGAAQAAAPFSCDATAGPDPGPTPLNQLTRAQYLNTLRELFGSLPDLSEALGQATTYAPAFGLLQPDIDAVQVTAFQSVAELIAAKVVSDPARLAALAPCAAGSDQRQCARNFVEDFAARAYRAPLTDAADLARHLAVYDAGAELSHPHGIELLLRSILQAPRFLYRVELGTSERVGDKAVLLSGHELAARLAYVVWDGPPDAELVAAAGSGELRTKPQLTAQLTRMLASAKGASFVQRFLEGWTELASLDRAVKDAALYPEWSSELQASQKAQAQAFFQHVLSGADGKLEALLTSQQVLFNRDLAPFYGKSSDSASFQAASYERASGLLTLPALLSSLSKPAESSPIYRGKFVREQLLCQLLPAPPPNIPKPPDVTPGVSTRERLSQHEVDDSCSGCHELIDPIGFGFEQFDAIGRFRTTDGDQAVDASGRLTGTDVDGDFDGVVALGQKLAGSAQVRECVTRQWFRFTAGRFERDVDGCSLEGVLAAFADSGWSLNALPQAIVESDAFLYRRPIEVEP